MDVYETVKTRLTVRRFKSDPVPDEVVRRLLEAARWSPSSRNLQPWRLVVVRERATLAELGRIASSGRFLADAPMAIAVAMENADSPWLDAGRMLQQMELVAWAEGLGTCFVGLPLPDQSRRVKELLGIPERLDLITILPFGYRTDDVRSTGRKRRRPMSEIVHVERFGESYPDDHARGQAR